MSDEDVNELKQYISVMIREIGEMRKDFEARFEKLEGRIGGLEERMGGLEASMNEVKNDMREMKREFRAMTRRFDRLEARVLNATVDVDEIQDRVAALEGNKAAD